MSEVTWLCNETWLNCLGIDQHCFKHFLFLLYSQLILKRKTLRPHCICWLPNKFSQDEIKFSAIQKSVNDRPRRKCIECFASKEAWHCTVMVLSLLIKFGTTFKIITPKQHYISNKYVTFNENVSISFRYVCCLMYVKFC